MTAIVLVLAVGISVDYVSRRGIREKGVRLRNAVQGRGPGPGLFPSLRRPGRQAGSALAAAHCIRLPASLGHPLLPMQAAHICRAFLSATGTRDERAHEALRVIGGEGEIPQPAWGW